MNVRSEHEQSNHQSLLQKISRRAFPNCKEHHKEEIMKKKTYYIPHDRVNLTSSLLPVFNEPFSRKITKRKSALEIEKS